jgi:hypothetical protein
MTYFVELDLPNQPLVENFERPTNIAVSKGSPTYISISLDFIKIEIIDIFKEINLEVLGVILFRKHPSSTGPVHRDLIFENNKWKSCNYGVNWNLDDTHSIMEWYSTDEKEIWPFTPWNKKDFILSGINYGYMGNTDIPFEKFKLLSSLNLTSPTLVRTDIPHRVKNLDVKDRWCISLRFKQDLSWPEAEQIFSKFYSKK